MISARMVGFDQESLPKLAFSSSMIAAKSASVARRN
jgi:hypothetical protein